MNAKPAIATQRPAAHAPTLRLLGDFAVEPPALAPRGRKARALLARLVLADGPLSRDRLSALLWSHRADVQAHASLRQCLVELKSWTRAFPPLVRAERDTVAIDRLHVADDISLLRAACAADNPDAALHWLPREDIALLADLDGVDEAWDDWLAAERARQSETIVRDVLAMAERLGESGEVDQMLVAAERVTHFDPCSEHAARLVMRARWQAGDGDGVRHAWQRIEDAVARGLDGKPAPETLALYRDLAAKRPPHAAAARSDDPPAVAPSATTWPRRLAAAAAATLCLAFVAADSPLVGLSVATPPALVMRIEPVASRGSGALETRFADALAGDFVRLANASDGGVRVLDSKVAGNGADIVVRVAVNREAGELVSESRLIDAHNGSILWSNRLAGAPEEIVRLRERTAVSVAGMIDCAQELNGKDRALAADADHRGLVFAVCDAGDMEEGTRAIALLETMTGRWPRDANALGRLALTRAFSIDSGGDDAERQARRAQTVREARQALAIDPENLLALVALSQSGKGNLYMVEGLPMLERALTIDPGFSTALMLEAIGLFQAGFVEDSVEPSIRAADSDPTSIEKALTVVRRLAAAGHLRKAADRFAAVEEIWPEHPYIVEHRFRLATEMGRGGAAAAVAAVDRAPKDDGQWPLDLLVLRQIADPDRDRRELDVTAAADFAHSPSTAYLLAAHYTRLGDLPTAFAWLGRAPVRDTYGQWSLLFWPSVAPLRRDPRFFAQMARLGLVDYWRRHDRWPDFCREPGLRYDCRREAARLTRAGRAISGESGALQ